MCRLRDGAVGGYFLERVDTVAIFIEGVHEMHFGEGGGGCWGGRRRSVEFSLMNKGSSVRWFVRDGWDPVPRCGLGEVGPM